MATKEYELWNTHRQMLLGKYRTQSEALAGFYDNVRYLGRVALPYLDLFHQRPYCEPTHLISGRDDPMIYWLASLDSLHIELRLFAHTDIVGIHEWLMFHDVSFVTEDVGRGTQIDFQRYEIIVGQNGYLAEARGATELEGVARALVALRRDNEDNNNKPVSVQRIHHLSEALSWG